MERIRRIEELQQRNLQLYKAMQKQDKAKWQLAQMQDIHEPAEGGRGWDDEREESEPLSSIHYSAGTFSANNTIGELLSPLALGENQLNA